MGACLVGHYFLSKKVTGGGRVKIPLAPPSIVSLIESIERIGH